MRLEGGCECGAVRYRLDGPPIIVNGCHCRDCQKSSGTSFAVNAMVETARIAVTAGEAAERFYPRAGALDALTWCCASCGTLLWAAHPVFGDRVRFVAVGTLDRSETLAPDAHYFVRSKHPWVTLPDGVPAFDMLPDDGVGVAPDPGQAARMAATFGNPAAG